MVGFEVELERIGQAVAAQEGDDVGGVEIVLMNGRLLRLRLDQELAGEADLLLVLDCEMEEPREMVEFAFQVGVVEVRVTLTAAPEDVVLAAELLGDFERLS